MRVSAFGRSGGKGSTQEAEESKRNARESHVLASSLQTIFNQDAGDGAGHGRDHQGTHSQKHSLSCLCLDIANVLSTDGVATLD